MSKVSSFINKGGFRRSGEPLDFLLTVLAKGGGAPLAFVANIGIARILGPDRYGLYMTLLSASLVISGFAAFGSAPLLAKEIAIARGLGSYPAIRSIVHWVIRLVAGFSLLGVCVLILWLTIGRGAPTSSWASRLLASAIIPASVAVLVLRGILGGFSKVAQGQLMTQVGKNTVLLVGLGAVLAISGSASVSGILALQLGSVLAACTVGILWVNKAFRTDYQGYGQNDLGAGFEVNGKRLLLTASGFLSMSVAMLLLDRLDVVIVEAISGPTQAGYFGAAARLGQIAPLTGVTIIFWLQPRMAKLVANKSLYRLRQLLARTVVASIGMTLLVVLSGFLLAPKLMGLLGHGFGGAVKPFRWLLVGYLFWAVAAPYYVLLTMSGREKAAAFVLWAQCALTLGLSVPLVMRYLALGGALAWMLGNIAASITIIWIGIRQMRNLSRETVSA